jgi:phosphoribosyl-ATP pyrophosphohydrolase
LGRKATVLKMSDHFVGSEGPKRDLTRALAQLEADVRAVVADPARHARTAKLISAGTAQQAKKVAEEAAEVLIEAVRGDGPAAIRESADLVYNLAVLLTGMGLSFSDVCAELERRREVFGIAAKLGKQAQPPVGGPAR